MRMLIRRRYVRRVARMVVGVRSGMVLMLGLRRERLGRGGRCPRPVVRPVAFIGAIHLQGRISSTQPEESHPPSARDDTKGPDTGMIVSARAPFDHSICGIYKVARSDSTQARISIRPSVRPSLRLNVLEGFEKGGLLLVHTRSRNITKTHVHTARTTAPTSRRIEAIVN